MIDEIQRLAKTYGWDQKDYQKEIVMISFCKFGFRMNIYMTKMTVGVVDFSKPRGINTSYYKGVWDLRSLEKIFANPGDPEGKEKPQKRRLFTWFGIK